MSTRFISEESTKRWGRRLDHSDWIDRLNDIEVFRLLRYDNLKSPVMQVLRGHRREKTTRFIAFHSHWCFETDFCMPAQPHEKDEIEGEAGYFRRIHWVPPLQARDLEELNAKLLAPAMKLNAASRKSPSHAASVLKLSGKGVASGKVGNTWCNCGTGVPS